MRGERRHVGLAVALLVFVSLACKVGKTPPSVIDASDVGPADVAEEFDEQAIGSCSHSDHKCLANGKAAYCKNVSKTPRSYKGEWVTFTCNDCAPDGLNEVRCSTLIAGEPCDGFSVRNMCTSSKMSMFRCDFMSNTWVIDGCPGGCKEDRPFPPTCNR